MKKLLVVTVLLAAMSMITVSAQNKLTVEVTGIKNPTGKLYVALFDTGTTFLTDKAVAGKIEKINDTAMQLEFDVADGEYAIAIFQDENDNAKLDLGQWGIPTEKYGFSNNVDPAALRRPPVFEECKFTANGNTTVVVTLTNAIVE
ncbi:DUF2141 domain-containing protein [Dysgonomonas sp. 25]|uniref:DUF2141 domain-containing protein n=1 Tax=Dysgonomonas sp. 25 TaxID=2302933 RepID=UPI0013D51D2B|nr:DUF2141 domain-containing protein [Dysgonomonas sp. 25]NDV69368.1 DUF2141 domain-containing protein [Dysgonomonas sp. 25]